MKPVLVDTSVWRLYLRGTASVRHLGVLLEEDGQVLGHPFVLGELVLGGLAPQVEGFLARLPAAFRVPDDEVLDFARYRRLERRGIGWVDVHLLASALASGAALWSTDKKLVEAATALRVAAHLSS